MTGGWWLILTLYTTVVLPEKYPDEQSCHAAAAPAFKNRHECVQAPDASYCSVLIPGTTNTMTVRCSTPTAR